MIIKEHIKEYNQEILLKPEFEKYNKIIREKRKIPEKIEVKAENVNFFNETLPNIQVPQQSNVKITPEIKQPKNIPQKVSPPPPTPIQKPIQQHPQEFARQEIPKYPTQNSQPRDSSGIMSKINYVESEINKALVNQDIARARTLYIELKKLFTIFPDEEYDLKTDLFTDLLSSNFRIHQLAEHLNKLKKVQLDRIFYEQKTVELEKIKQEKNILEKRKIDREIDKIRNQINIIKGNPVEQKTNKKELTIEEKEIQKIKKLAILERLKDEAKRNKKDISYDKLKRILLNTEKTDNIKEERKSLEIKKNDTIKKLYSEGVKTLFNNQEQKAKSCFKKILEINPNYKPALIRLAQIS